ncbi:carboxylesterase/lipase family protein [Oribacterium sp. FC2011]|uniref:carboxylesterase/lipase family protein n=1 Tax=Oribacterium sp. FC2011 TaxID=1408311 RepID=UPI000678B20E|nr:carboxylesterase family protein [Oribacterium sp. FC2011]
MNEVKNLMAPPLTEETRKALDDARKKARARYGENKKITDGNYDKSLAVKCINGTFVGRKSENIIAYKGIPFTAKPPVGELRWKAPVEYLPDDGIYEAYYNAKSPRQMEDISEGGSLYYQSEDCLYLNVWKAEGETTGKKPVMVWIHGGGYAMGATGDPLYDLGNIAKENPDVIFASIAYRVGVFGYIHLSHLPDGNDYPDAQNLGPMDQMMALKWIHENIEGFGGDPDNVTIFGESAGAGSVTMLPLVEGSHKYIRRVIAQSGGPSITISTEEAIGCTNEVMEILGCKTVAELNKVDAEELLRVSAVTGLRIGPERDGKYLPVDPYDAYAKGAIKDIEILHGCNKDEMNYFVHFMGPELFGMWSDDRKTRRIAGLPDEDKELIERYCDSVEGENYEKGSRLFSQLWFNATHIRMSEEQAKAGGKSYTYYFTIESSLPYVKCSHAIELSSVLNHPDDTGLTGRVFDETFSKTVRKMWVQFAKTGNPSLSADISPDGKAHEWPLYDRENREVMVFDEFNIHPEKESVLKIIDWDNIYPLTKYFYL